jgi:hypothetical protein
VPPSTGMTFRERQLGSRMAKHMCQSAEVALLLRLGAAVTPPSRPRELTRLRRPVPRSRGRAVECSVWREAFVAMTPLCAASLNTPRKQNLS